MKHGSVWTEWFSKHYTLGACVYYVSINPYQVCPGYNKQGFYFLSCQPWQADADCQSQTGIFQSHITWPVRKILLAKICPQLHSCNPVTSIACPQWHQSKSLLCKGALRLWAWWKSVVDSEEIWGGDWCIFPLTKLVVYLCFFCKICIFIKKTKTLSTVDRNWWTFNEQFEEPEGPEYTFIL